MFCHRNPIYETNAVVRNLQNMLMLRTALLIRAGKRRGLAVTAFAMVNNEIPGSAEMCEIRPNN